ncbi:Cochaperone protein [Tilletia horrida]|uniref:Cochaperone protein n=1 Tax=Tilletia horrida TaxID=155126 RepID=A0AAN6GMB3_9BASI|nr:Cochaperone protein [Tilletia horrida]KAK0546635.1 Cochaperone protein [Tilletia horrida]KAK0562462.1 Cochaperone protein [Tilletia horrida]
MAIRRDFYQTDTHVHVSIYARNLRKDSVEFTPEAQSCSVFAHADFDHPPASTSSAAPAQPDQTSSDDKNVSVVLRKLFAPIDPSQSSIHTYPNKIELRLAKVQVGVQWPYLNDEKEQNDASSAAAVSKSSTSGTLAPTTSLLPTPVTVSTTAAVAADAPKRKKNKWENFKVDDEDDDDAAAASAKGEGSSGGGKGGGDVNDFFKQLYAGATDDARRAMIKSYQESNGTTLSMNWDEVKKGKVETRPPDSMVPKKYGE